MKKIIAITLVSLLVLSGCAGKINKPGQQEPANYKIGSAVKANVVAVNAEADKDGKFESNVTYVTVALDEDDKFAYVLIDEAQNAFDVTTTEVKPYEARKTKKDLGLDYNLNWMDQVADLEKYLVGKTLEEVKSGDPASDLNSTVSIQIGGFLEAIEEAVKNAVLVENVTGIASDSSSNGTFENGEAEIATTVAAVATGADGTVLYSFIDEAQLKATIENGTVTPTGKTATKGQQKEEYGMSAQGKVEWYLQVQHLTDWTIGKKVGEISKAADNSDVNSTVSIYPGGFINTLVSALGKTK